MLTITIEFCINNLANGAQRAREQLEKDPNFHVIEYGCLGNCGKCTHLLYALVNGKVVQAHSADKLVAEIYRYVEEELFV